MSKAKQQQPKTIRLSGVKGWKAVRARYMHPFNLKFTYHIFNAVGCQVAVLESNETLRIFGTRYDEKFTTGVRQVLRFVYLMKQVPVDYELQELILKS